mgnify:CR=1 FL=1
MAREIMTGIRMGDWIHVSMVASNASYNPDIADDLARRTTFMFMEALNAMDEFELIDHSPLEDEEEEEVKELDPRIVRFIQDGWEGNPDA